MASEKLIRALESLNAVQQDCVIQSRQLNQRHREILIDTGYLREVIRGWYVVSSPQTPAGSTLPWYSNFWSFLQQYLQQRFEDNYSLAAESSIKLHVRSTVIPSQISVMVLENIHQTIRLPADLSLCIYSVKSMPDEREKFNGMWVLDLPAAIVRLAEPFYRSNAEDAEIALRSLRSPSGLLRILLDGGNVVVAGRLVGAYRFLGNDRFASEIKDTMHAAHHVITVSNPFDRPAPMLSGRSRSTSPYADRILGLWAKMRGDIIEVFHDIPRRSIDLQSYIAEIEERYASDAYNSLSIEGYRVSPELIERVRSGNLDNVDVAERDALAARGYYQAFQAVKDSVRKILDGADAATVIDTDLRQWHRQMFLPMIDAGIYKESQLVGYRNHQVFLAGSKHVPPAHNALIDCMDSYTEALTNETEPIVRAILGHYIFVFIHPHFDGNGRLGRFIMNAALVGGGYPWTVIRLKNRTEYMKSLEKASIDGEIRSFAEFVREEMIA